MANSYFIEPANPLQALMAGVQGYDRAQKSAKEADILAGRQSAMQALQSGGDPRSALARLIGVGDVQGARAIADFAESQATQQHRQQQMAQQNRQFQASHGLAQQQLARQNSQFAATHGLAQQEAEFRRQQAADAARGFDYREIDDGSGGKTLVRIHKATGQGERVPIGGEPPAEAGNPFGTGKFNEVQGRAAGFTDRMLQSERILQTPQDAKNPEGPQIAMAGTSATDQTAALLPFGIGNYAVSNTFQRYEQAKRDFINAQLRRESGAVISPQEFESANKQYFPMPGDNEATIRQKAANRRAAIQAMGREGGPAYRPNMVIDNSGRVIDRPQARSQTGAGAAPVQGARQAPDGNWYVERGGKFYRVER